MRTQHFLKTEPQYFRAVNLGEKTFELRFNDRDFRVGDTLVLVEYRPDTGTTGRQLTRVITYITQDDPWGALATGWCILGLAPLEPLVPRPDFVHSLNCFGRPAVLTFPDPAVAVGVVTGCG